MYDMIYRVCKAYTIRNPEIGYCQGFNLIVGRFLKIMNEEESFWMLVMVLENYLPIDYYLNIQGIITDNNILLELIKEKFPKLYNRSMEMDFQLSNVTFQWLCSLFSYNFSYHIVSQIWDQFFLKGQKIIFRIALSIFHVMMPILMQAQDYMDINDAFRDVGLII